MEDIAPAYYTRKKILSNVLYLFANQGVSKAINLVTTTLIIRTLGPNEFGNYAFGLAIIGYSGMFVNFGLSTYGAKQINQTSSQEKIAKIISEIVSLRLLLAILTYIPFTLIFLAGNASLIFPLIILNVKSFADAVNIEWYFKAILKNKYVVIATILQNITHLVAVLLLYKQFSLIIACIAVSASFAMLSIAQIVLLYKYETQRINILLLKFSKIKSIIYFVWPFFLTGLFSMLFYIDTIFLKIYTDSVTVGYYNGAQRIIDALTNLRYSIAGVLYPVYAQLYFINPEKLLGRFYQSFKLIMAGIFAIGFLIHLFADEIILTLFGTEFSSSVPILRYLILTSLMLYVNALITSLYNAIGLEKKVFFSTLVAGMLNVLLNSILVLKFQAKGAVVATLLALLASTILLLIDFPKALKRIRERQSENI